MQKNKRFLKNLSLLFGFIFLNLNLFSLAHAACGTTITWQANANTTAWNTASNWSPANVPDVNTETAFIIADWQIPTLPNTARSLSCLEINSGSMTASASSTLTIINDYFKNLNSGSLIIPGGSTFTVSMSGTATQSFQNVDPIPRLTIANSTTVNLTHPFVITNLFTINAGTGNVNIQADLEVQQTSAVTIPSSATVTVSAGKTLKLNGGITINGVLKLLPGARLLLANGRTLSVGATGTLQIAGTAGNAAIIDAYNSSSTFTFNVAGKIDAEYFSISRMTATGMNITGTILDLSYGDFNAIPNLGYGVTLGVGSNTSLSTLNGLGFYGPSGTPRNFNATSFAGTALTISNWSGLGDTANETDPSNKINWGTEAPVQLLLTNNSPSGAPPTTIARSSAYTHFATFAFALSDTATASDITSIVFTLDGSNANSDITGIRVYRDDNTNCVYNAGVDSQVGGTFTPAGSPGKITATFTAGQIQVSSTAQRCVHVLLATSATAGVNNTIGIKIAATDDIVNSQSYGLSNTSGPPVSTSLATVTGTAVSKWAGGNGSTMAQANNWSPNGIPNSTLDCEIGVGYAIPIMAGTFSCLNADFVTGGSINWNSTANIFAFYGALTLNSSYTFTTATNGILRAAGTGAQSVTMNNATFPGNFEVSNTTGPVTFENSGTITGNLTLNGGTTRIANGTTLTVSGNIIINTGATLDIEPGGTLVLANSRTITVNNGGTLEMIGTSSVPTTIRAINTASSYTIAVTGTIRAQYYALENLGLTGLTVNALATIDATYHLQNGSFTYPGVSSAQMLRLLRQVPTNTLDNMTFDLNGSGATSVKSITTNTSAGTLNLNNYSGNLTGAPFSTSVNYIVTWVSLTNTIDIALEASAPGTVNQGAIANMGRFSLKQTNGGAFSDTDVNFIRVTLSGTGAASDVDNMSLYYDSTCTGTGGTLVETKSFSGSPARADFSTFSGATIPFHATTPPKRCFYVMFSVSALATNSATIGYSIESSTHITNSIGYAFNGSAAPPVSMGTSTIVGSSTYWTGAVSTAWATAGNWNGGVPTSSLNCFINAATNNPIISTGVASCNALTIGNGTLTMTGGQLEVYGSFENTGTFTQGGRPLILRDNGSVATSQSINSAATLDNLSFNKTAGGSVNVSSSVLNVTSAMTLPSGNNFTLYIGSGKTLSLIGGLTITGATLDVQSGGELEIGASQTLLINGGTLKTTGTNDAYPQSLSNKGTITRRGGSGTWNFTATSGTVNLLGFVIEWLGTSGVNIGGTTNITQINGGQLRNLPNSAGMRAIQFNNTGSLPSTISNFGWYWGSSNSPPSEGTSYFLAASTGCSSRTVSFDQWFGDFWPYTSATTDSKISEVSCNIVIDKASSPVSLTEFRATPYDGKVVLDWTTGLEWLHRGFNVYRSLSPDSGYTQINSELIRNDLFTTTIHGTYAFIDEDVTNNTTYYYKLEDISNTEERTLHGPVIAKPALSLGVPPPPLANTIVSNSPSGSGSTGGSPADVSTPGLTQLESNITVIAKTAHSYRLKIVIPNHHLQAHPTHPTYQQLSIPLYSRSTQAGAPELLTRTLMLKIPQAQSAQVTIVDQQQSSQSNILIAPAPAWSVVNGNYTEQWTLNTQDYSIDQFLPASPIQLGTIIQQQGQHYLPILIHPHSYNPTQQSLVKYNELLIDIFLNGDSSWQPEAPIQLSRAWSTSGGLKIGLGKDGIFNLTYDDMVTAGVIAPFDHIPIENLKLYIFEQEQPIDIISSNGVFDSGDQIRFFARNVETVESEKSYALLVADHSNSDDGLRMQNIDKTQLNGQPTDQVGYSHKIHLEQNNMAIFNEPYDDNLDRFVWGLFYAISGSTSVPLVTDATIEGLVENTNVTIHALVKSRSTSSVNYPHHLQLFINSSETANAEVTFETSEPQIVSFNVPSSAFVDGLNRITIQPTGSLLVSGEYDMVYIDKIDIYYTHDWTTDNDKMIALNSRPNVDLIIDGFTTNNLVAYDISKMGEIKKLFPLNIQLNGTYTVHMPTGNDTTFDRRLWISSTAQLQIPASLELIYGSDLKNPSNQANVIYIGARELIDAVEPLAELRTSQGYKTQLIELNSIYNEFGYGVHSTDSIREFINYAHQYWSVKPNYIILLGDGSYDPKGYQNDILALRFPVKLIKGSSFDYGSDHWFVTSLETDAALAVVARIPARSAAEMTDYVNKVIAYESGSLKPIAESLTLISDKAHYNGENFDAFNADLQKNISTWAPQTSIQSLNRTALGDSAFKSNLQQSFSQSAIIHYMGHGAENMWADNHIFNTNDIDQLTNTSLPVITAMNCLNANFYDPSSISLAEKLVLKKSGGAIAFWGSTSMTPPSVQSVYQKAFYQRLFAENGQSVGDAIKLSKSQAELQSPFKEATYSWTIIGDPLVKANVSTSTQDSPTSTVSPGGGSKGCSAFAGVSELQMSTPWELVCAFLLECLIALAVIRFSVRLVKK